MEVMLNMIFLRIHLVRHKLMEFMIYLRMIPGRKDLNIMAQELVTHIIIMLKIYLVRVQIGLLIMWFIIQVNIIRKIRMFILEVPDLLEVNLNIMVMTLCMGQIGLR